MTVFLCQLQVHFHSLLSSIFIVLILRYFVCLICLIIIIFYYFYYYYYYYYLLLSSLFRLFKFFDINFYEYFHRLTIISEDHRSWHFF
ncbi:hypothetical protein GLOIN_2v1606318 [Rhizophagus irregularis DAOM 181602=DAOM 197198]|nr:hypothetical protein GLOIN_2v1606318 [Rhizophagus irregularis DAOM 181602=DAOM 197198]